MQSIAGSSFKSCGAKDFIYSGRRKGVLAPLAAIDAEDDEAASEQDVPSRYFHNREALAMSDVVTNAPLAYISSNGRNVLVHNSPESRAETRRKSDQHTKAANRRDSRKANLAFALLD